MKWTLQYEYFPTMEELVLFVNSFGILRENIQGVYTRFGNIYELLYWEYK